MKAISLWEPYASLIMVGGKTYETRSWKTKYRGDLLICAAKRCNIKEISNLLELDPFQSCLQVLKKGYNVNISDLNFGKAVRVVKLVDCIPTEDLLHKDIENEQYFGDFSTNRYAWKLELKEDITPFFVKGKQGFFNVPDSLIKKYVKG